MNQRLVSGFLWLATVFAGTLALDRSFLLEREEGCWESLRTYPLPPSTVYFGKLIVLPSRRGPTDTAPAGGRSQSGGLRSPHGPLPAAGPAARH
ncbi:MAG: hypothetical protein GXY83_10245 [Rhodopirellula sp.]|nr:hypothetical protein [Rhodopirellula sp.]